MMNECNYAIVLVVLVYVLGRMIYRGILYKAGWTVRPLYEVLSLIFVCYLTGLFSYTISPIFGFHLDFWKSFSDVNLVPFKGNPTSFQLIGNIVMFLPLGIMLPLLSKCFRRPMAAIGTGFAVSLGIEICQLFLTRATDIDDLLMNILGCAIGWLLTCIVMKVVPSIKRLSYSYSVRNKRGYSLRGKLAFASMLLAFVAVCAVGFYEQKSIFGLQNHDSNIAAVPEVNESSNVPVARPASRNLLHVNIEGEYACVLDVTANKCIYQKSAKEQTAPASTTKLLSTLTAFDYCNENDVVTVGQEIRNIDKHSSKMGLAEGMRVTVKELYEGMLLPSGNDAAYVLAVYAGKRIGAEEDMECNNAEEAIHIFVEKMNEKAKEIGATHSHFVVPDGFDREGQYTTAYDMTCIASAFLKNSFLTKISGQFKIREVLANGLDITLQNTNELLDPDSEYYYPDAIGLKTGSTSRAGKCLVSAAKVNGHTYIAAVMASSEDGRFADSVSIYKAIQNQ